MLLNLRKQAICRMHKGKALNQTTHPCSLIRFFFSLGYFTSIQRVCKRATKALIRLRKCAVWSGPSLHEYNIRSISFRCAWYQSTSSYNKSFWIRLFRIWHEVHFRPLRFKWKHVVGTTNRFGPSLSAYDIRSISVRCSLYESTCSYNKSFESLPVSASNSSSSRKVIWMIRHTVRLLGLLSKPSIIMMLVRHKIGPSAGAKAKPWSSCADAQANQNLRFSPTDTWHAAKCTLSWLKANAQKTRWTARLRIGGRVYSLLYVFAW